MHLKSLGLEWGRRPEFVIRKENKFGGSLERQARRAILVALGMGDTKRDMVRGKNIIISLILN